VPRAYYAAFFTDTLLRRVMTYAIVLYGAEVMGRGAWAGALYVCIVAPYLLSIYAGSLIDTLPRVRLVRQTAASTLVVMGGFTALTYAHVPHAWPLATLLFVYGLVSAFAYPAYFAGIADLADPDRLATSTVGMNVLTLASQVAGPVFVGVLRAFLSWPQVFAAATLLAAVQLIALRTVPWGRPVTSRRSFAEVARSPWADMAELHAYTRTHATLATLVLAVTLFSTLAIGPLEVLVPLIAPKSFALSSAVAGLFMATGGVGLVVGALAALKLVGRVRTGMWICMSALAGGIAVILMTVSPEPLAFALYLAAGIAAGVFSSLSLAAIQQASTGALRGRVLGLFSLVLGAPPAIGGAAAGVMSDSIGAPAALRLFCGVGCVAFLLLLATRPALRAAAADAAESTPPAGGTPEPA
jgi:MFS family permease